MTMPLYEQLTPLNIPLADFLEAFHPGPYHLRSFPDRGGGAGKNYRLSAAQLRDSAVLAKQKQANSAGQGIFFVVNPGGHNARGITGVAAQFMEADDRPLGIQREQLRGFALAPSIVVRTRKSLHAYWLLKTTSNITDRADDPIIAADESRFSDDNGVHAHIIVDKSFLNNSADDNSGALSQFTSVQKQLAAHFGGDPVISNPSRVMRLPGFDHQKAEPVAVVCLKFDPGQRYRQSEIRAALQRTTPKKSPPGIDPAAAAEAPTAVKAKKSLNPRLMMKRCAFLNHARDHAPSLPEPLWYAMITLLGDLPGGAELIHKLSRDHPGYESAATDAKIRHFLDSGTKAISCQTLKDWGYVCPLRSSCSARSPRELGIPPLPVWYEKGRQGPRLKPAVLANVLARKQRVFFSGSVYYCYRRGVYTPVSEQLVKKIIRRHLSADHATMAQINDVMGQWTVEIIRESTTLNRCRQRINLKNGLLDLSSGELLPHDPGFLTTIQLGTAYEKGATAPLFEAFLEDCLEPETRRLVQEIMGYLLIPETCAQKAFVFVGAGGAGKSTLLAVAQELLLGRENVANIPWQSLGDRFKTAELFGKLANIFADLPFKSIDDNGLFKSITGEDMITAERKNKDPFAFLPTARLLFSCNEIPRNLGDRGEAFYRRLVIVPFLPPKPPEERNPYLKQDLATEAPGILNWALAGLRRLMANDFRFSVSPGSQQALKHYRIAASSVLSFVEEQCRLTPDRQTGATALYCAYGHFCQEGGLRPVSQKRFWQELKEAHPTVERTKDPASRRSVYKGIILLDFEEVA
jgi:P4 family phage/plasmid primase-like protien